MFIVWSVCFFCVLCDVECSVGYCLCWVVFLVVVLVTSTLCVVLSRYRGWS